MIEYRGISKRYGDAWALKNIDLDIERGTLTALIGPSGSGKTTCLRMLNRLVEPDEGSIRYDGRTLRSFKPEALRRGMGYVIQNVGLFPHLTVLENICTVPRLLGTPKARAARRADELLALVGLDPALYRGRRPRELSGGEAQRVGVARALAADPPLLLMDEPFGAVDPLQRGRLQEAFLRIQREIKKTVLLVTHDLDEAVRLADTIVLMRAGTIVQRASPATLLREPADDFVRDFVGEDRSLKRLARVSLGSVAATAPAVALGETAPAAAEGCDGPAQYWVLDGAGKPIGRARPGQRGTLSPTPLPLLSAGASLKEALAAMLEDGHSVIGVLDESERLIGEIAIGDIISSSADAVESSSGGRQ
ncbi:MAG TPA: hypothetical protein DCG47_04170 [Spirochaetaceae bacterium]|nr:hypothetical protein [Spirochaetaceae bacterium]